MRAKDPNVSFHCFPSNLGKKQLWIEEFGLLEGSIKPFSRVCNRHFRNGDPNNGPDKTLDTKFASPKKARHFKIAKSYKTSLSLAVADLVFKAAFTKSFLQ